MNPQILESLRQIHPFFQFFPEKIHFFQQIEKLNSQGHLCERFLVITSPAVFILNQRSFPRVLQVRKCIPMVDIKSIILTETNMTLNGSSKSITFKHPKHLKIAYTIYSIRSTLTSTIPLSLEIDPSLRKTFDQQSYDYSTETILPDLFLSFCLMISPNYDQNSIIQVINSFLRTNNSFNIDSSFTCLDSSYFLALSLTISCSYDISQLVITGIPISSFLTQFSEIIRISPSITKVTFRSVTFDLPQKEYLQLYKEIPQVLNFIPKSKASSFMAHQFTFLNCNFSSPSSTQFFESFQSYQGKITTLCFEKCSFIRETLDSLFQSIFFSSCFHSLENLLFSSLPFPDVLVDLLLQLACCGWLLETRCLKTISVQDCNIDSSFLLSKLLQLDAGIVNLDLSGSNFQNSLDNCKEVKMKSLSYLSLNHSSISEIAIKSFFTLMSHLPNDPNIRLTIDLSKTDLTPLSLPLIRIPCLYGFYWGGNQLNIDFCQALMEFFVIQLNLVDISLSQCFTGQIFSQCSQLLLPLFKGKPFNRFSISIFSSNNTKLADLLKTNESNLSSENENYIIGDALMDILELVVKSPNLKSLDISGQNISGKKLIKLLKQAPSLEEIEFEGFKAADADELIEVLTTVINKNSLKIASWPANDIKMVFNKTPLNQKGELQRLINIVKRQFETKFGNIDYSDELSKEINESLSISTLTKLSTLAKLSLFVKNNAIPKNIDHAPRKMERSNSLNSEDYIRSEKMYDEEMLKLLKECEVLNNADPIEIIFFDIDQKMGVDELWSAIESMPSHCLFDT